MHRNYSARTKSARKAGQIGARNMVKYGQKRERYKCKVCNKTFSGKQGTMFEGLRKPTDLITMVVTLLAYGCPVQAVVHAALASMNEP